MIDNIITRVVLLWKQTDDLNFAIESSAQRFGLDPKTLRRLVLDRLMEADGVPV